MDFIDQGATWRRRITIQDETPTLIDPSPIVACLCPETPITVTRVSAGVYDLSLDATATGALTPGPTHWELLGQIGSDAVLITRQQVIVTAVCARLP